jgi:hypothetical protein
MMLAGATGAAVLCRAEDAVLRGSCLHTILSMTIKLLSRVIENHVCR